MRRDQGSEIVDYSVYGFSVWEPNNRRQSRQFWVGRHKKSFEFRFWWISRNQCILKKYFAFFEGNWILNKCVATRGRWKPFEFSFWWISRNLCTFKKYFARKFIVGNWIFNECAASRGRKKPFKFSIWWIS